MAADFGKNPFLCDEGRIREDRRKKGWEEEMGRKEEKRSVSFQRHLLVVLSFFIIPMLFFLFLYNYYSVQTLNNEVAQIGDNMIELYRSKTERDLYSLSMTIAEYWANDYDHVNMVNQVDPLTRHLSGYEIGVKYRSLLSTNHFLEGIAIISMKNQLQRFYFKERLSALAQHKEMKNLAGEWLMQPAKYIEKGWQPVWICGDGMLMRMLGYKGGYTILFVNLEETIWEQLANRKEDEGVLLFSTWEGEHLPTGTEWKEDFGSLSLEKEYLFVGTDPTYMLLSQYSEQLHVRMLFAIPYKGYFSYMDWIQRIFLTMSILTILAIPVGYYLVSRYYFRPMKNLIRTMKHIRDGNPDERCEEAYQVKEFQEFGQTFNEMITEIQNLKLESWEQERQKTKAELQYFQIQLRPHFFLNCLKNLYAMAEIGWYDRIQEMILQISRHLRYFFKDNMSLVTIKEELEHVKNYVALQREGMGQDVELEIDLEEGLSDCKIPVLLLQAFVENSFKYGRRENKGLQLGIRIYSLQMEEETMLDILITDNGKGFAPELLRQLNEGNISEGQEEHIGILNVRQRLFLLYGEQAVLQHMNLEEGAQNEIILPKN